jgi:hypothetical protein
MLNLKKLFSEAGKKREVENFAHFCKRCVFLEKRYSQYFVFFDLKEAFAKIEK